MNKNIKVIGKTGDGFIVECPEDTLYYLTGLYRHEAEKRIEVGTKIKLGELFDRLRSLRYNEQRLKEVTANLQEIIKSVTLVDPIVTDVGLEEPNHD